VSKPDPESRAALEKELELVQRELRELRALQRRFRLSQLEAGDHAKLRALLTAAIEEAEAAGEDEVLIELNLVHRDPRL